MYKRQAAGRAHAVAAAELAAERAAADARARRARASARPRQQDCPCEAADAAPVSPGVHADDGAVPMCPICLEPLQEGLAVTACGHVFHHACLLETWEGGFHACPKCREPIASLADIRPVFF